MCDVGSRAPVYRGDEAGKAIQFAAMERTVLAQSGEAADYLIEANVNVAASSMDTSKWETEVTRLGG
jgi:hypothetical protein